MKKEAMLYEKLGGNVVLCHLCSHRCKINESKYGFCGVRQNMGGTLYSLVFGETIVNNFDPIEKKPLYHFLPGSYTYSIATIGCNFHCGFCQNWQISQASKKDQNEKGHSRIFPPEDIVAHAKRNKCASIAYTYTEPTIFFEYAYETGKLAKEVGLKNIFVTNGYMTEKALETIAPYLDAANVDLKAWSEDYYQNQCKGRLEPVLDTLRSIKALGVWLEITTLVVPGENDSEEQLNGIAQFIADLSEDIPWHISRFHPNYQLTDLQATPMETLQRAKQIGKDNSLNYVYIGNAPADNNTYCPECKGTVVKRTGLFRNTVYMENRKCPFCGTEIAGVWE